MKHEMFYRGEVRSTLMLLYEFFLPGDNISCSQSTCERGMVLSICWISIFHEMMEQLMQQYCIKFCQKLGDTKWKPFWKIQQVLVSNGMGITQIKEWYNHFIERYTSVESNSHFGMFSTIWNDKVVNQAQNFDYVGS